MQIVLFYELRQERRWKTSNLVFWIWYVNSTFLFSKRFLLGLIVQLQFVGWKHTSTICNSCWSILAGLILAGHPGGGVLSIFVRRGCAVFQGIVFDYFF